ncbi:MAG: di-heme-cytochrome C peroxidase [Myxococcota bacterium]
MAHRQTALRNTVAGLIGLALAVSACKDDRESSPQRDETAAPAAEPEPEPSSASDYANIEPPPPTKVDSVQWLEQGWTDEQRRRFYYLHQGAETFPLPYEWFMALEQPSPNPAEESPLLSDPAYLERFGFIRGEADPELNPDGLPIGFARIEQFDNPIGNQAFPNLATGKRYDAIGFTCGACHTGQLEYQGKRVIIDGGQGMIDVSTLSDAVVGALAGLTSRPRGIRFVMRVLPKGWTLEQQEALVEQLKSFLLRLKASGEDARRAASALGAETVPVEGFIRLDAFARIGNQLFWTQQRKSNGITGPELDFNYALTNAPVNYPPAWTAPWFDWVQFNGSLKQPMFRNYFESLGGGARMNLGPDPEKQLSASPDVRNIRKLEHDLAGEAPFAAKAFTGLRPPKWPADVLGPVDTALVEKGATLYAQHCQHCHLPPLGSDGIWDDEQWVTDTYQGKETGIRYLKLDLIPLDVIGTDPGQAKNMAERQIQLPEFAGGTKTSYREALMAMQGAITKAYDEAGIPEDQRAEYDGHRDNVVRTELAYRPRPLDGVWATAPFLHNGSVPNLYALLSPVSERPEKFYLGSRQFDPKRVGYEHGEGKGLTLVDTSIGGNLNTGHEFTEGSGKGIIGPALSEDDRWALVEYLKTL